MGKSYIEKAIEKAEELEWYAVICEDGSVEFEKYSPAGEDFVFYANSDSLARDVRLYAEDFDIEDHVRMWLNAKENGVGGVPGVVELVDDARDIEEMLGELADALEDLIIEEV